MARHQLVALSVAAAATVLAGGAMATPGSGVLSSSVVARGHFLDQVDVRFKVNGVDPGLDVINAPHTQDTVIQHVVLAPDGQTGWHSHPGPAVAIIIAGELTLYSGDDPTCSGRTYLAGETLVDSGQGHVHIARNLSSTDNAELWVTYFDVPPDSSVRIDVPDPGNCAF